MNPANRELTIEDLHHLVGAPLELGVVMLRRNAEYLESAWETPMTGARGWAWAISLGQQLIAQGWTSGNRRDRDREIARAVAEFRARRAA